jgi:hypothetical protein
MSSDLFCEIIMSVIACLCVTRYSIKNKCQWCKDIYRCCNDSCTDCFCESMCEKCCNLCCYICFTICNKNANANANTNANTNTNTNTNINSMREVIVQQPTDFVEDIPIPIEERYATLPEYSLKDNDYDLLPDTFFIQDPPNYYEGAFN